MVTIVTTKNVYRLHERKMLSDSEYRLLHTPVRGNEWNEDLIFTIVQYLNPEEYLEFSTISTQMRRVCLLPNNLEQHSLYYMKTPLTTFKRYCIHSKSLPYTKSALFYSTGQLEEFRKLMSMDLDISVCDTYLTRI